MTTRKLAGARLVLALLVSSSAWATDYTYDRLHRLTQVVYDDGRRIDYEYDAVGNRTFRVSNGNPAQAYLAINVDPPGSGSVLVEPTRGWYPIGSNVDLTALPGLACEFDQWFGDVPAGQQHANPLTLTLTGFTNVTARFNLALGDGDADCDIDLADYAILQECFGFLPLSDDCAVFDFNNNGSLDPSDFDAWTQDMTGPWD